MSEPNVANESSGTVGVSVQTGVVQGDVHVHQTDSCAVTVPRQLPGAVRHFIDREVEQDALTTVLAGTQASGGVTICAVDGVAGVGKSTLAVYWSHQMRERFPDGELYVNLRGFDPIAEPMSAADALGVFLTALDVPAERMPQDVDSRAATLRSLLHGKRILLLLDNARSADQVRPLLPGSQSCFVLVTSRNRLDGLVVSEGAVRIPLDLLGMAEATKLLGKYLGAERITAEPDSARKLVEYCAGLPLALGMVAVRAAETPDFPLDELVTELRDEWARLDALDSGGETGIRAVFSWSYRSLSTAAARLFRLLGLPTGPDISLAAAADLAGLPQRQARLLLGELTRAHLVEQHQPGRFRFHDLLRAYAAECAIQDEAETDRLAAIRRLLDHYLRTSRGVRDDFLPHIQYTVAPPESEVVGLRFDDLAEGRAWWERENATIVAAIRQASSLELLEHTWQLAHSMMNFFHLRHHIEDWLSSYELALAAAQRLDDRRAYAHLERELGLAYSDRGDLDLAERHWERALRRFEELDDASGELETLINLGLLYLDTGRLTAAESPLEQALTNAREAADRFNEGAATLALGRVDIEGHEHEAAIEKCEHARECFAEVGEDFGRATAQRMIGDAYHGLGRTTESIERYRQSRAAFQEIGHRYREGDCLRRLGAVLHESGEVDAARQCWHDALALFDEIQHPDADEVRAMLADV